MKSGSKSVRWWVEQSDGFADHSTTIEIDELSTDEDAYLIAHISAKIDVSSILGMAALRWQELQLQEYKYCEKESGFLIPDLDFIDVLSED